MSNDVDNENQSGPTQEPADPLVWIAKKVLENQETQLELQKQNIAEGYKYAAEVVAAQAKDRQDERDHRRKVQRERMIFAGVMVLVLAFFVGYALHLNKDQIALEIIKAIAFLAAGGMGGYALGRYRSSHAKDGE